MAAEFIHDRGRGPEIVGTRITVYNLLPHFLDPAATETQVAALYNLTPEQVAAARAYVLNNVEAVLAEHRRIEAKLAAGNPPEVIERAKATHDRFEAFRTWLARAGSDAAGTNGPKGADRLSEFRAWLVESESRPGQGS